MNKPIQSENKNNLTPIFLIGAMKSGTSSLFKYLEYQDEICFPPIKEPEYFSQNMGQPKYKEGSFWDLFDIKPNHKFIFDGSTGYTKYPSENGVPKRIYDYGLQPRFIYIVRNPFDRIESHYNFMKRDLKWKGKITSEHLVNISKYYLQLSQYRQFFNKKDFLILDFDELKHNPQIVIEKIGKHIGIENIKLVQDNIKSNATKAVSRKELEIKRSLRGKFTFLPKPLKSFGKKIISKIYKKRNKKLSTKQRKVIYHDLKEDMYNFKAEYGFPIEKWGFK